MDYKKSLDARLCLNTMDGIMALLPDCEINETAMKISAVLLDAENKIRDILNEI